MLLTSAQLRRIARPLLGLLLFAQGVVAAENCVALETSPVHSFVPAMAAMLDADGTPCHMQAEDNKNACFVHCSQEEQVQSAQADIPFIQSATPVLVLDIPAVPVVIRPAPQLASVSIDTGPPLSIRFCSFLI